METAKAERQSSSYPRAGLILRTSSFKNETSSDTDKNAAGKFSKRLNRLGKRKCYFVVENVESRKVVTKTTVTSSKSGGSETFLSNKSRVTGVQDVINRMSGEGWFGFQSGMDVS